MPKYKIVKVESFAFGGKRYKKGDVVELPERYGSLDFTEPVEEPMEEKPKKK